MNSWFTVKVKYIKQFENGALKSVSEPYLLAAMSFTDAEARIYEELGSVIRGEFTVTNIARTDYHDIFKYDDTDVWFKCKITYESQDAEGEKAKKIAQNFLVSADTVAQAYERMKESLSTLMVDFVIPSIIISPIIEIFPFNEELDKEISRRPMSEEDEPIRTTGKKVFSAPGSDLEDEEIDENEDFVENEVSDSDESDFQDDYSEK
jgi:hypothetical protein